MGNARFIKHIKGVNGDARLYVLSHSISYDPSDPNLRPESKQNSETTRFVIVSAIDSPAPNQPPETYIFPATEGGKFLDMLELSGSFKGEKNHRKALKRMGFPIQISTLNEFYRNATNDK